MRTSTAIVAARSDLLALFDDVRCDGLHVQRLELGEWARHVQQREGDLSIHADFKAALAWLLLVDDDLGRWKARFDERFELRGPRLECASGLRARTGQGSLFCDSAVTRMVGSHLARFDLNERSA